MTNSGKVISAQARLRVTPGPKLAARFKRATSSTLVGSFGLRNRTSIEPMRCSPLRVKLRRTQYELMFSALPSNSDIARRSRHVSNVPLPTVSRGGKSRLLNQALPLAYLFHCVFLRGSSAGLM